MFDSPTAVGEAAAQEIVIRGKNAIEARGRYMLALSGGSTPAFVYRALARPALRTALDWNQTHLFWGDERAVPPDHVDSNYGLAARELLDVVEIPDGNVHRIPAELGAETAAEEYDRIIRAAFGIQSTLPRFDLVMLGLGTDGHTASLFPRNSILHVRDRLVASTWVETLRTYRVSLTIPVLQAAATVLFLVTGTSKAEVLRSVLHDAPTEGKPASLVQPANGELVWLVDREAAHFLELNGDI